MRTGVAVLLAFLSGAGASVAQIPDRSAPTPPRPIVIDRNSGRGDDPNAVVESQAMPPPGEPLAPRRLTPLPGSAPRAVRPDGSSVDAIVAALYESVSHGPDYEPNWGRLRSLFLPAGRLIPPRAAGGGDFTPLDVAGFQSRVTEWNASARQSGRPTAFFEKESSRRGDCFGSVCQVFSTYESRRAPGDASPFARGMNGIQLLHDGRRWWIASIAWDTDRPDNPIPAAAGNGPRVPGEAPKGETHE